MYTEFIKKITQTSNKDFIEIRMMYIVMAVENKVHTHACKYGFHYIEHPTLSHITIPT